MMRRHSFVLRNGATPQNVTVEREESLFTVTRGGTVERATAVQTHGEGLSVLFEDGRQICGQARFDSEGSVEISMGRGVVRLWLADPLRDRIAHAAAESGAQEKEEEVRALMPGRILEVCVNPGDSVDAGGLLFVIEAMKMQNEIRASARASVVRVHVSPGEAVESGALLLALASRPIL